MDIQEAIKLAQKGEAEAFGIIYDQYAQRIFRFIKIKAQNQEQAEDLLQDVFVKIWTAMPNFRIEGGNFQAWAYKIASNTINDYLRKIYRQPHPDLLPENLNLPAKETAENSLMQKDTSEQVKRMLDFLPEHYRQVLELRFIQEFNLEETSKILGKSNLATRLIQHRALKKLKKILNNTDDFKYSKIQ